MRYSFSLVPEKIPEKRKSVKGKQENFFNSDGPSKDFNGDGLPKEKAKWKQYLDYFDECYMEYLNRTPPARSIKSTTKYKKLIETAIEHWGEETFKKMIEWICKHANEYPNLTIDINLVVGGHRWANFIAQQVQQEDSFNEYYELEEF